MMPGHLRPVPRAAAEAGGRRGHGGQLRAEDDCQVGGEGQDAGVGAGDLPSQVRSKLRIPTCIGMMNDETDLVRLTREP